MIGIMEGKIQTVIGGGVIGTNVLLTLQGRGSDVRLVDKISKRDGVESLIADMTNKEEAIEATKGSSHVYLCVGLPYNADVWQKQWLPIVENVIHAAEAHNARLIFFDNMYMYGPLESPIVETNAQNPSSKKGRVRKRVADMVLDAHKSNRIQAIIGRSADFYGPHAKQTLVYKLILENIKKDNPAQWLGSMDKKHSLSYAPDAARALVELALKPDTYGDVWHLPTPTVSLSGQEIIDLMYTYFDKTPAFKVLSVLLVKIGGLFNKEIKETYEMMYQYTDDYVFDSSKFKERFPDFKITSYEDGFRETAEWFRVQKNLRGICNNSE